jgi:hypothetical protein
MVLSIVKKIILGLIGHEARLGVVRMVLSCYGSRQLPPLNWHDHDAYTHGMAGQKPKYDNEHQKYVQKNHVKCWQLAAYK